MDTPTVAALLASPPRLLLTMRLAGRDVRLTDGGTVSVSVPRARATDVPRIYLPGLLTIGALDRLMVFDAGSVDRSVSPSALIVAPF